MKKTIIGLLVICSGFLNSGCEPEGPLSPKPSGALNFTNVQDNHQKPSKVQFIFSLRDRDNHAVLIPQDEFNNAVEVSILENNQDIDYRESHGFIHTAESFGMDVVLVLDYSASMAEGGGIDTMLNGVNLILDELAESHRVAIVEFHDNDPADNFSVLQSFTTDKEDARQAVMDFANPYNGFSTCWDAVYLGLEQFEGQADSGRVRNLVFLSDGFDNSSIHTPKELTTLADQKSVRIYNIGVGPDISRVHEDTLEYISDRTGGQYYRASDVSLLRERFESIIDDLGGNYKISYITPKRDNFQVKINLVYGGNRTAQAIDEEVDGAVIFDSDRRGLLSLSRPTLRSGEAELFISADHIPREISAFRFKVDITPSGAVEEPVLLVGSADGGLLGDTWAAVTKDGEGYYNTSGPALNFGDFGVLFKIHLADLSETPADIKITMDNSLYENGVFFYGGNIDEIDQDGNWEKTIIVE